jgi:hypothetical protein
VALIAVARVVASVGVVIPPRTVTRSVGRGGTIAVIKEPKETGRMEQGAVQASTLEPHTCPWVYHFHYRLWVGVGTIMLGASNRGAFLLGGCGYQSSISISSTQFNVRPYGLSESWDSSNLVLSNNSLRNCLSYRYSFYINNNSHHLIKQLPPSMCTTCITYPLTFINVQRGHVGEPGTQLNVR